MKIELGNYLLEHSATIIEILNQPIKITLLDEVEGDFSFLIHFIQDPAQTGSIVNLNAIETHLVEIQFVNTNQAFNLGNTVLIPLGTLRHRQLFFTYRLFDLVNFGKMIILNFYTQNVN